MEVSDVTDCGGAWNGEEPYAQVIHMKALLKVYGDTNTLLGNVVAEELTTLKDLWADERLTWFTSHLVLHEAMNTKDENKRNKLVDEHKTRKLLSKDEKMVGFNALTDPSGGFIGSPIFSDVQDENLRAELMEHGLNQRDAEHITQAVCNNCDVFLTRDVKTIISRHRAWLEERFPTMRILRPSELATALETIDTRP